MLEYVELIGHSMTYIMKALCLMGSKIVMDGDIFKCSLILKFWEIIKTMGNVNQIKFRWTDNYKVSSLITENK